MQGLMQDSSRATVAAAAAASAAAGSSSSTPHHYCTGQIPRSSAVYPRRNRLKLNDIGPTCRPHGSTSSFFAGPLACLSFIRVRQIRAVKPHQNHLEWNNLQLRASPPEHAGSREKTVPSHRSIGRSNRYRFCGRSTLAPRRQSLPCCKPSVVRCGKEAILLEWARRCPILNYSLDLDRFSQFRRASVAGLGPCSERPASSLSGLFVHSVCSLSLHLFQTLLVPCGLLSGSFLCRRPLTPLR